jgi:hypothetical protein
MALAIKNKGCAGGAKMLVVGKYGYLLTQAMLSRWPAMQAPALARDLLI